MKITREDLEKHKFFHNSNDEVTVRVGNTVDDPLSVDVNEIQGEFTPTGLRTALKITNTTVGTTAAILPAAPLENRNSMIIFNKSAQVIFVGNSDVATSGANEGWEIDAGSYFSLDITDDIQIYAICSTPGAIVKVMELA